MDESLDGQEGHHAAHSTGPAQSAVDADDVIPLSSVKGESRFVSRAIFHRTPHGQTPKVTIREMETNRIDMASDDDTVPMRPSVSRRENGGHYPNPSTPIRGAAHVYTARPTARPDDLLPDAEPRARRYDRIAVGGATGGDSFAIADQLYRAARHSHHAHAAMRSDQRCGRDQLDHEAGNYTDDAYGRNYRNSIPYNQGGQYYGTDHDFQQAPVRGQHEGQWSRDVLFDDHVNKRVYRSHELPHDSLLVDYGRQIKQNQGYTANCTERDPVANCGQWKSSGYSSRGLAAPCDHISSRDSPTCGHDIKCGQQGPGQDNHRGHNVCCGTQDRGHGRCGHDTGAAIAANAANAGQGRAQSGHCSMKISAGVAENTGRGGDGFGGGHAEQTRKRGPNSKGNRRISDRSPSPSGDSSDGGSIEQEVSRRNNRGRYIKPHKFDGSGSFETFYAHFMNCASYNKWNESDQLAHLKNCMISAAGQVLWDSSPEAIDTLEKLTALLKTRFGGTNQTDKYRIELKLRRRNKGETLSALHLDIRRLMALAHPTLAHNDRESVACNYFIDALHDPDIPDFGFKVQERNPTTLDEALNKALQLESWYKDAARRRAEEAERQRSKARGAVATDNEAARQTEERLGRIEEMIRGIVTTPAPAWNGAVSQPAKNPTFAATASNSTGKSNPRWPKSAGSSGNRPSGCWKCGQAGHIQRNCTAEDAPAAATAVQHAVAPEKSTAKRGAAGLDNAEVYLQMELHGKSIPCLVDSGCEITLAPKSLMQSNRKAEIQPTTRHVLAANGSEINVSGEATLPLFLNGRRIDTFALISTDIEEVMLGADWLKQHECVWDFGRNQLSVDGLMATPMSTKKPLCCRRVYLQEDVVLPPRQQVDVPARATLVNPRRTGNNWAVDTQQLTSGVYVGRTLLPDAHKDLPVRMINTSAKPQALAAGTYLGVLSPVAVLETTVDETAANQSSAVDNKATTSSATDCLLDNLPDEVTEAQRGQLASLLTAYSDVFSQNDYDVGRTTLVEHTIDTGNNRPIRQALRRHPIAHLDIIDKQVQDMLDHDIIEPAASPWASNVVLVRKKDGTHRFCVDYRAVNSVTYKDTYPLPHIDTCLNALNGSSWFTTLDLRSGYHNIPVSEQDRDKTAFVTRRGCWRYKVMPFGLTCAPSVFQRLMDLVLCGLSYETCMVFLDDIIIFARSFDSHLVRLQEVLERLRWAKLKIRPDKCCVMQRKVSFLGHIISESGVETQPEKVAAVQEWPQPKNIHEVKSFLGLCSYYRRFIAGFADIAAPLHALGEKNVAFCWTDRHTRAFNELKEKLTTAPVLGLPQDEGTFYLDTDASDFGLGSVLSQEQGGVERVIAYASKSLSRAEKNYCVTRRELLAVVNGLKTYKQFLLGRPFVIRTDHSALRWLQKTPEPLAQQARWLAFIEQFQFEIVHRPGHRHGNADGLSRRPEPCKQCDHCNAVQVRACTRRQATAVAENDDETGDSESSGEASNLAGEESDKLAEMQRNDIEIGQIVQLRLQTDQMPPVNDIVSESEQTKRLWSQWHRLEVRNGLVYRKLPAKRGSTPSMQLLAPIAIRQDLIQKSHSGMCGGHLGTRKTMDQVQRRAYWIGWRGDVARFCKRCTNCSSYHRGQLPRSAPLRPIIAGAPFERLSIDLTGPHTRSRRGSVYIFTCVDPFTKWAEAYPLPNKEAATVARVLVEQVFCRLGLPVAVLSDKGKEVDGNLMNEICRLLNIDKMRTTSYKASTNAAVERFHRTLNGMLGRVVDEHQKDWDCWLPYVMAAYRSSRHEATEYTPNYLMMGRDVRAPVDIMYSGIPQDDTARTHDDYVEEVRDRMREAYDIVREHLQSSAVRSKHYYDLRVRPKQFKEGDWVYYFNPRKFQGRQDKWSRKFSGPFLVTKVIGPVNVEIQRSKRSNPFIVHLDKIKPYLGDPPKSWLAEKSCEGGEQQQNHPAGDDDHDDASATTDRQHEFPEVTDDAGAVQQIAGQPDVHGGRSPRPRRNAGIPRRLKD